MSQLLLNIENMFSLPSYKPSHTARTIKAKDTKANERDSYKYGYPVLN